MPSAFAKVWRKATYQDSLELAIAVPEWKRWSPILLCLEIVRSARVGRLPAGGHPG